MRAALKTQKQGKHFTSPPSCLARPEEPEATSAWNSQKHLLTSAFPSSSSVMNQPLQSLLSTGSSTKASQVLGTVHVTGSRNAQAEDVAVRPEAILRLAGFTRRFREMLCVVGVGRRAGEELRRVSRFHCPGHQQKVTCTSPVACWGLGHTAGEQQASYYLSSASCPLH